MQGTEHQKPAAVPSYVVCWVEEQRVVSCDHQHASLAEAMACLVPDGSMFLRAWQSGVLRPLTDQEFDLFLIELAGRQVCLEMSTEYRSG